MGAILVGGAAWAVSAFLLPRIPDFGPAAAVDPLRYSTRLGQWLMFSYAGTILLLWTHVEPSRRLLRAFAWAGRMALTNYFVQIIILDLLFSGYAFGLSELAPALVLPATVCLFAAQAAFSRWWLSVYRFARSSGSGVRGPTACSSRSARG